MHRLYTREKFTLHTIQTTIQCKSFIVGGESETARTQSVLNEVWERDGCHNLLLVAPFASWKSKMCIGSFRVVKKMFFLLAGITTNTRFFLRRVDFAHIAEARKFFTNQFNSYLLLDKKNPLGDVNSRFYDYLAMLEQNNFNQIKE